MTTIEFVVLYHPLPSYIVQNYSPEQNLKTLTVTPATKTLGEFIMGDIQILTGVPKATIFVGYTFINKGLLIDESGYWETSQTKVGFEVRVGVPYSIHYGWSSVN